MGYETEINNKMECGCHTVKSSHDCFSGTNYEQIYCKEHDAYIYDKVDINKKIDCECGEKYLLIDKKKHFKSRKHCKLIKTIKQNKNI